MTETVTVDEEPNGGVVRRTVLDNGLRIITETLPQLRSAAFGIFVGVGSRDESVELAGASHFLEHLLFKGTKKRSTWDIASQIEAVGGDTNAYTGKEYTCFYARVLDRDVSLAVDVITDMIANSVLDPAEMDIERGVVLEEIGMHADEPDDAVHDLFIGELFGAHPLGRPILGTSQSIAAMPRDDLYAYYRQFYQPHRMVISAAGNIQHDEVVAQVEALLGQNSPVTDAIPRQAPIEILAGNTKMSYKDTDLAHLIMGAQGINRYDDRRYALTVLNQILGGGMSSRLFQEIREKRGLAYSVYSFTNLFADAGICGVYVGCAKSQLRTVIDVVAEQLTTVVKEAITAEELARGIGMVTGSTVLGLEDSGARMERIGKGELLYGDFISVDELLRRISAVTVEQVKEVAIEVLDHPLSIDIIGPISDADIS
jgi:predicted Zn-dependent peptidase